MDSIYLSLLRFGLCLVLITTLDQSSIVLAITAPELRGNRFMDEINADMHGRKLQQQEFLKADLQKIDFSESDLRGTVFNNSDLRNANLNAADLQDVVAFASRFDGADLRQTNLRNGMLIQSKFKDTLIEGADFTDAILDLKQQKILCSFANGTNLKTGVDTKESLRC
uniref:Uncharacterized protein n=1 Tax=Paulinella chromatophora TaxID=39717 RepID=B1X3I6_PAUCH|nr:hypothetical protein PCC_0045 [Paulinella chromatophora]ACB42505.1 hypothetical protein PCC_0045 [Paulinella chromatophora]